MVILQYRIWLKPFDRCALFEHGSNRRKYLQLVYNYACLMFIPPTSVEPECTFIYVLNSQQVWWMKHWIKNTWIFDDTFIKKTTTTTTVLWPLNRTTCIRWHLQLRTVDTRGFCWRSFTATSAFRL